MVQAPELLLVRPDPVAAPLVMLVLDDRWGPAEPSGTASPAPDDPVPNVQAGPVLSLPGVHFANARDLGRGLLATLCPDVILSPLVVGLSDVIDIATHLQQLGYAGRYRALAADLPDPALVIAEVRAVAPNLDFDLYLLTSPAPTGTQPDPSGDDSQG